MGRPPWYKIAGNWPLLNVKFFLWRGLVRSENRTQPTGPTPGGTVWFLHHDEV